MNSESGFIFKTTGFSLYIGSPQKGEGVHVGWGGPGTGQEEEGGTKVNRTKRKV